MQIDDDEFYTRLMAMRGGCRCQDPGAAPPCSVCTSPATDNEVEHLFEDLFYDENWLPTGDGESYQLYLLLLGQVQSRLGHVDVLTERFWDTLGGWARLQHLSPLRKMAVQVHHEATMPPEWGTW